MIDGYKVVVVTPAGRERYLSIFRKYIERDMAKGLIDEWQLWMNTDIAEDIAYMEQMCKDNPRIEMRWLEKDYNYKEAKPGEIIWDRTARRIHKFFVFAQDDNTIYLRMDDDVVFIEEEAILNLLKCRLENPDAFVITANIVNNSLMGYLHQLNGALTVEAWPLSYMRYDQVGAQNEILFRHIHNTFKKHYEEGTLGDYEFASGAFSDYEDFSITCFCFWGKDHLAPEWDEELWISQTRAKELERPNMICGDALVVHFAYHTQAEGWRDRPEYLEYYKQLSEKI